jgi:hypothetical protein
MDGGVEIASGLSIQGHRFYELSHLSSDIEFGGAA